MCNCTRSLMRMSCMYYIRRYICARCLFHSRAVCCACRVSIIHMCICIMYVGIYMYMCICARSLLRVSCMYYIRIGIYVYRGGKGLYNVISPLYLDHFRHRNEALKFGTPEFSGRPTTGIGHSLAAAFNVRASGCSWRALPSLQLPGTPPGFR